MYFPQKVEASLEKKIFDNYKGYRFKFVSISKNADKLREQDYKNPYGALFSPDNDIIDIKTILNKVLCMQIDKQKQVYEFIKKELGNEIDIVKVDSNLATIINILAGENLANNIL